MVDIYLQLMMHGELNKRKNNLPAKKASKKDRFDLAYHQLLDNYVNEQILNDFQPKNLLIPKALQRDKLKKDLIDNTQLLKLDITLEPAVNFLTKNRGCLDYINADEHQQLFAQFTKIPFYLEQIDFKQPLGKSLYSLLHITESTVQAILKVGIAKYNEQELELSSAIFSLLSSLDHENDEYWYRLGIIAAQMDKLDLALQAFAYALYFNTEALGARLFSADCYLKLDQLDDAAVELEEAKKIIEAIPPEQILMDLLASIEEEICSRNR